MPHPTQIIPAAILTALSALPTTNPAPDFTAVASNGQTYRLSDQRGKYVVLEWHDQTCPYVAKQYDSSNMQKLQKDWTARGVIWFTVVASTPGPPGNVTPQKENIYLATMHAAPTAALMDFSGDLTRLYHATTTPQMFLINPQGEIIYNGAIDNKPTPNIQDIPTATNYVNQALTQSTSNQSITTPTTPPYGCPITSPK